MQPVPSEVSCAELRAQLASGADVLLLDCREADELAEGAIEGSVHIPMGDIPVRLNELEPERPVVVYCRVGFRSMGVAVWLVQEAGFERVASLRGGIEAWMREGGGA